jgi:hypothetical protein
MKVMIAGHRPDTSAPEYDLFVDALPVMNTAMQSLGVVAKASTPRTQTECGSPTWANNQSPYAAVRTSAKSGLSPEVLARSLENGVTKWFSQISLVSRAQRNNTASRETHCHNQRTLEISEVSDNLWILRAAIGRL